MAFDQSSGQLSESQGFGIVLGICLACAAVSVLFLAAFYLLQHFYGSRGDKLVSSKEKQINV